MESKVKSMGHPMHPMLVNFPLGLLVTAAIFDIVHLITGNGYWSEIAFWMIAAGLIGGLIAAAVGIIDWFAIPAGTRGQRGGLWHGGGHILIPAPFIVNWVIPLPSQGRPFLIAFVLFFLGAAPPWATRLP